MAVHRVTLDQFSRILIGMSPKLEKAVIRGLRSAARRLQGMVVEEIDIAEPYPAVDRGELRSSVEASNVEDGSVVHVDAPHAPVMEHGARPFWPPRAPLARWALRKGIAADEDEAEEIAGAIQKKMAWVGIEPRNYMGKAFSRIMPVVIQEVERELEELD